ncbi:MAG: hypothetical protein A4E52_01811 [Pelotomaculum sp. PtaB.Bin013]|nr:MAG: hypothetical protein A4E52_01811 [Pelotomaculum sp. PtaB.Bin013]
MGKHICMVIKILQVYDVALTQRAHVRPLKLFEP